MEEFNDYITELDAVYKRMIDKNVADKGIEKYLSQQLIYLDCSRVINGMRMMQTIGYPYKKEISSYIYALNEYITDIDEYKDWHNKLVELHHANLEYEKDNPPVWYGGKRAKDKWLKDNKAAKLPHRKKCIEGTIPGMSKEISSKERLKKLNANFSGLIFKIKPPKKD